MHNDNPLVCPTCGKRHACEHGHAPVRLNAIAPTWIKENPNLNDYQVAEKYDCSQMTIHRARVELKKHDVFLEMPTHKQSSNGKKRPTTYTKKPKEPAKPARELDPLAPPTHEDMIYLCEKEMERIVRHLPELKLVHFRECLEKVLKRAQKSRAKTAKYHAAKAKAANNELQDMEVTNVTAH